jgi:hypothetical protein
MGYPLEDPEYNRGYNAGYSAGVAYGLRCANEAIDGSTIITAAKRDLAEKVLTAIGNLQIDDRFSAHQHNGFGQCKGEALRELRRIFTESGIDLTSTQKGKMK